MVKVDGQQHVGQRAKDAAAGTGKIGHSEALPQAAGSEGSHHGEDKGPQQHALAAAEVDGHAADAGLCVVLDVLLRVDGVVDHGPACAGQVEGAHGPGGVVGGWSSGQGG